MWKKPAESKKPRMKPMLPYRNTLPMSDLRKFDMVGKRLNHNKKNSKTKGNKFKTEGRMKI